MWAIISAAPGHTGALDAGATHHARLALLTEQPGMVKISVAVLSVVNEARIGRTAVLDRIAKNGTNGLMQASQLWRGDAGG